MDASTGLTLALLGGSGTGDLLAGVAAVITAGLSFYSLVLRRRTKSTDKRVDNIATDNGAMEALRKQVASLEQRVVEVSTATGAQLTAAAVAVSDCEERHQHKDEQMESMEKRITLLARAVHVLHATIHAIHPDLVTEDPGPGVGE